LLRNALAGIVTKGRYFAGGEKFSLFLGAKGDTPPHPMSGDCVSKVACRHDLKVLADMTLRGKKYNLACLLKKIIAKLSDRQRVLARMKGVIGRQCSVGVYNSISVRGVLRPFEVKEKGDAHDSF